MGNTITKTHRPILIVEDSDADFEAMTRCLKGSGVQNPIHRCEDGSSALAYLSMLKASSAQNPSIIFLDLNLPGADGREILQRLKSDDALKVIPVLILSSSDRKEDVQLSYRSGANTYVQKPHHPAELKRFIEVFRDFWLHEGVLIA